MAVLGFQIHRRLRHADAIDELRRGAGAAAQLTDTACDEARIAQVPDAHGGIDAFLHEIEHAVVETHLHRELRMLLDEARQRRHDDLATERDGHIDAQLAACHAARFRDLAFGLIELGEGVASPLVEGRALVGEAQGTGRPIEQARGKAFFQTADGLADRRGRHAERLSGRDEAAGLDDSDENDDVAVVVQKRTPRGMRTIIRPDRRHRMACFA